MDRLAFAITNHPESFVGTAVLAVAAFSLLAHSVVRNGNRRPSRNDDADMAASFGDRLLTHDQIPDDMPERVFAQVSAEMGRGFNVPRGNLRQFVRPYTWEEPQRSLSADGDALSPRVVI